MTKKDYSNLLSLAVDTSGRAGSVCIGKGEKILAQKSFSGMMRHAAELFPTILELLKGIDSTPEDIKNVYVTIGPGSFTGLRIGITLAKMMALAQEINIASVSTLDVIAQNAFDYIIRNESDQKRVASIIDAKRQQFFVAVYELIDGKWEKVQKDAMMNVETFQNRFIEGNDTPIWLLGEGLKYYKNKFESANVKFFDEEQWFSKSENVYKLGFKKAINGDFDNPETLLPSYLRLAEAEENWIKKAEKSQ